MGQKANRGRLSSKSTSSGKGPGLKRFDGVSKVKGPNTEKSVGNPGGPIPIPVNPGGN